MISMVEYVHQRILTYPMNCVGVDFTMGNGYDTEFLINYCHKVYAFDIQKEAVEKTRKKVGNQESLFLILDGHENVDAYLKTFDIGIFNLGYLPCCSHHVTTLLKTTQIAVEKAISMMTTVLFIVVYPGHHEGLEESQWLDEYVKQLDTHQYNVSTYRMMNKNQSPYVIEIEKRKPI